jgi:hypothetical protein
MIFAVLATGQSLTQDQADAVNGRCRVVAVSNAYKFAPWADALASCDASWWKNNPEAMEFAGRKFTTAPDWQGLSGLERVPGVSSGTNSGLLGLMVAVKLGATRILLLGYDMQGTHFFGAHPAPLRNPNAARFEVFQKQFSGYKPRGVEIINCTPGSALRTYPMGDLHACFAEPALHGA